jgi:EAL domain-containing protein (putative c-di-GMP-specific phosphodiesterase class I)
MAVNLSAHSLHDDRLPERVQALLDEIGLPASVLTLEVTEGSVVSEPERAIPILVRLSELGCQLSLDDFGTGFSSLSYLQNLPVQEIKIDRSFITGFLGDRRREALVAAIIGLAESLNLRVVAEGIEDGATLDQLRIMGCGAIQGYFLSRPAGPEQLTPLLTARGSAIAAGSTPAAPAGMVISPRERGLLTR